MLHSFSYTTSKIKTNLTLLFTVAFNVLSLITAVSILHVFKNDK